MSTTNRAAGYACKIQTIVPGQTRLSDNSFNVFLSNFHSPYDQSFELKDTKFAWTEKDLAGDLTNLSSQLDKTKAKSLTSFPVFLDSKSTLLPWKCNICLVSFASIEIYLGILTSLFIKNLGKPFHQREYKYRSICIDLSVFR